MKITENNPPPSPPPPATYTLELTLEQLVGLGALSFCHETIFRGKTFYRSLPGHIQTRVEEASARAGDAVSVSAIKVDWSA